MPEEINRILTDHMASLLFTTERSGNENLLREGIPQDKIHFVGNTMIVAYRPSAQALAGRHGGDFRGGRLLRLITLHRPPMSMI
jgi:UDP-N-acetylglucosamine 2-epimerase (non-hydrolysing)